MITVSSKKPKKYTNTICAWLFDVKAGGAYSYQCSLNVYERNIPQCPAGVLLFMRRSAPHFVHQGVHKTLRSFAPRDLKAS
jgi:hypothetical protein